MDRGKAGLTVFFEGRSGSVYLSGLRMGNFRYAGWSLGANPGTMRCGILSSKIITA